MMLDRKLMQDDSRGLEQGLVDNKRTPNRFKILVELFADESDNTVSR